MKARVAHKDGCEAGWAGMETVVGRVCGCADREIEALRAERDHYQRESDLGATMLGVIVSSLGLGAKATTKAGASVQDVLDHVAALRDEVERFRIAHDRADGALADAETVPTGTSSGACAL